MGSSAKWIDIDISDEKHAVKMLVDCYERREKDTLKRLFKMLSCSGDAKEKCWASERSTIQESCIFVLSGIQFVANVYTFHKHKNMSEKEFLQFNMECGLISTLKHTLHMKIDKAAITSSGVAVMKVFNVAVSILRKIGFLFDLKENSLLSEEICSKDLASGLLNQLDKGHCFVAAVLAMNTLRLLCERLPAMCLTLYSSHAVIRLSFFVGKDNIKRYMIRLYNERILPYQEEFLHHLLLNNYPDFRSDGGKKCCLPKSKKKDRLYRLFIQVAHDFHVDAVNVLAKVTHQIPRTSVICVTQCYEEVVELLTNPILNLRSHDLIQSCVEFMVTICVKHESNPRLIGDLRKALSIGLAYPDKAIVMYFTLLLMTMDKENYPLLFDPKLPETKHIMDTVVANLYANRREVIEPIIRALVEIMSYKHLADDLRKVGLCRELMQSIRSSICDAFRSNYRKIDVMGKRFYGESWSSNGGAGSRENPKEAIVLKDKGNEFFRNGSYLEAISVYSRAISICPVTSFSEVEVESLSDYYDKWWLLLAKLYTNRAQCHLKVMDWDEARSDCQRAISLCFTDYTTPEEEKLILKTTFRRAKALWGLKQYLHALNDIAFCFRKQPSDTNFRLFYNEVLLKYRKEFGHEVVQHCGYCGGGEGIRMKRCGNCMQVYCSKKCQELDWIKYHKELCKSWPNL